MVPTEIKVQEKKFLFIKWNDKTESKISLTDLRRFCPCAICTSESERHHHDYIIVYSEDQTKITGMKVVGNYALSVVWSDGHNTGFYDFSYLKKISTTKG